MKISHEKGIAIHSAPNFCAACREACREASRRGRGGLGIELRKQTDQDADAVRRCGRPYGRERKREFSDGPA